MSLKHLIIAALLLSAGCAPKLVVQQTLAQRVHRATLACVAAPAGAQKARVCAAALLCQTAAKDAATALQDAQKAVAAGDTDVAAETKAAGLSVVADTACRHGGF